MAPIGRILGDSLGELNLLRFLPELASHLRAIRQSTEIMATEVRGMHSAVRRLEGEVHGLQEQFAAMDEHVGAMEGRMARLEPYLADVNLAVRPLRRARARLPHRSE